MHHDDLMPRKQLTQIPFYGEINVSPVPYTNGTTVALDGDNPQDIELGENARVVKFIGTNPFWVSFGGLARPGYGILVMTETNWFEIPDISKVSLFSEIPGTYAQVQCLTVQQLGLHRD